MRRRQARDERGASLVEFALILPVFMALVLGMFSGGGAYRQKISMEDAVRDGARFGAIMPTFDADEVKARVAGLSGGDLDAGEVCAALVTAPDVVPPTCGVSDPEGSAGKDVVKVSATTTAKLEAFFFSRDLTLRARAAARYER